ncbi:MAG: competence/damage-inducible protein A [Deltaproteobacteria bacterium]|nr:competence/damage-inducible protein A [Deltaproteobacteria bacterium]
MHGEIITIGNELVNGRTLDLNAWYAAGRLAACGLTVTRITTVGDHPERAVSLLREALAHSRFVIVTGGLGSTEDDVTSEIVAEALGRPLCRDEEMFELIRGYVTRRGREMTPSLEKMAWVPEGSRMINPRGSACGFSMVENEVLLYFLPGVPDQMRYLMDRFVLPEILEREETLPVMRQRVLKLYGPSEPELAELLKGLSACEAEGAMLGFYPHFPENHITISVRGKDEPSVMGLLGRTEREIRRIMGSCVFASGNDSMEDVVGRGLKEKGLTLATAESCTGGRIGDRITDAAGSSSYFPGGVVAYSNEVKKAFLGVSEKTLQTHGAVSDATAREMARGVKERFGAGIGLSVTGIAGPGGGSRQKPVGTVHIGLASDDVTLSGKYRFWGGRGQVKAQTAMMALDWVRRMLYGYPFLPGV